MKKLNIKETLSKVNPKVILSVTVGLGVIGIVATYGAGGMFQGLVRTAFASSGEKLQIEFSETLREAQASTKKLCETEMALAKEKLANYYKDSLKLSDEDKMRLSEKAEGRGLDCFILAAGGSQKPVQNQ